MTDDTITREQAFAEARAVLDRARIRIAADRTAGRLPPEHELIMRRLEREQRQQQTTGHRAA
ncbi:MULTISPECIES: hypothetical protein [unclassified Streptomyces]|uniref:hypothetical protein n=1 Tax=Streptomyces sp. NPDC055082 TaxID=3365718 RepID=UPI0037D75550